MKFSRIFSVVALAFLITGSAVAQSIVPMNIAGIRAGSTITYKYSNGESLTVRFDGKAKGLFKTTVFLGNKASGLVKAVEYFNAEGNLVRQELAGNRVRKYVPHACERVIGPCRYVLRSNRPPVQVYAVGKKTPNGITVRHFYDGAYETRVPIYSVEYTLGKAGVVVSGQYRVELSSQYADEELQASRFPMGGRFTLDSEMKRVSFSAIRLNVR